MKKRITLLILGILFTLSVLGLTACNSPTEQTHEHTFATEWTFNENSHYHVCTFDGCSEISENAPHNFEEITENETLYRKCTLCDYKIEIITEEHEHTYAEEFSFDENYHYHVCTFNGCGLKSEVTEHTFENPEITQTDSSISRKYICLYCGYVKTETITVETIIENEEKWQDAFSNLELVNYSLHVTFRFKDGSETHNECHIDENGAYVSYHDGELICYFMRNEDDSFSNYRKTSDNDIWEKSPDSTSLFYEDIIAEATLPFSLEDNFDKFIYDQEKGAYLSTQEMLIDCYAINQKGEKIKIDTLCAFNAEVRVIDGAISYISSEYYFPDRVNDDRQYSLTYWNIGMTKVVLPTYISDNAIESTETPYSDYQ